MSSRHVVCPHCSVTSSRPDIPHVPSTAACEKQLLPARALAREVGARRSTDRIAWVFASELRRATVHRSCDSLRPDELNFVGQVRVCESVDPAQLTPHSGVEPTRTNIDVLGLNVEPGTPANARPFLGGTEQ